MEDKVTIIGSGFGGLSAACYLQKNGMDVTVLEKNNQMGGVASTIEKDGYMFDFGPSWYLMPEIFDGFFEELGVDREDYYSIEKLNPEYKVKWTDGDEMTVTNDVDVMKKKFEKRETGAGEMLEKYLEEAETVYQTGMDDMVSQNRTSIKDFIDPSIASMENTQALSLFRQSMEDHVDKYFDNEKLRQVVLYNLVFLGGSPSSTPAIYKLMGHVTFTQGVYYPEGGIRTVIDSLIQLGDEMGVDYRRNSPVENVSKKNGSFEVEYNGQNMIKSNYVVSNADYQYTERELLDDSLKQYDDDYWSDTFYAPGAYLLYAGVDTDVSDYEHHSLVFPENWDDHFRSINYRNGLPRNPAYYVNFPSLTDPTVSPAGKHTMVVLVPIAPGLDLSEADRDSFRNGVLNRIDDDLGIPISENIETFEEAAISEFRQKFNRSYGSGLGVAHTVKQTSILRPNMESESADGLYFTGGDTQPGIGMPMCLLSGRHVGENIVQDK